MSYEETEKFTTEEFVPGYVNAELYENVSYVSKCKLWANYEQAMSKCKNVFKRVLEERFIAETFAWGSTKRSNFRFRTQKPYEIVCWRFYMDNYWIRYLDSPNNYERVFEELVLIYLKKKELPKMPELNDIPAKSSN